MYVRNKVDVTFINLLLLLSAAALNSMNGNIHALEINANEKLTIEAIPKATHNTIRLNSLHFLSMAGSEVNLSLSPISTDATSKKQVVTNSLLLSTNWGR